MGQFPRTSQTILSCVPQIQPVRRLFEFIVNLLAAKAIVESLNLSDGSAPSDVVLSQLLREQAREGSSVFLAAHIEQLQAILPPTQCTGSAWCSPGYAPKDPGRLAKRGLGHQRYRRPTPSSVNLYDKAAKHHFHQTG
jgi:hypothetical protein